ncbi:LPS O-antigen chain length determinant protein WzzB [Pseudomonas fluorescens]|uniref:Wzz/FepE/Etk N-terminal domain-containing protein n=1 Tax=Pseudomonas TaxID=286 RepID=UPI000DD4E1D2|nr:Wzz/FepE/Etk N-terminal domain-containing protein [Pseudomonas sp. LG1E9]MBD8192865.1 LPS O-antigen chain length determinant protein WzzB [Pseudomonas fluorescens]MCM2362039.1 Wzz/FepE/Etk N-terminal domain-containing protein [Pseudomonas sp. SR18]MBD8227687.1 LPS O-antigen chain length determinant protein WzzB [Pseudomonas fluorescens]MBD8785653.1 LPS O-antigen chain length determinant protein WzzB [Pseudomonas fluorescens]MBD8817882.1 LPS O-antigen chain length determinant protein WzzB [P
MSSNFRAPPIRSSDEIDLVVFFKSLWPQKKLLLLITLAGGLIAASYAFLATPKYEISAVLRPAAINELDALNRSEVYQLSPGDALLKVGASLESYDTRLAFFRANQNLFEKFVRPGQTLEQSFEAFNRDSINLTMPDSDKKTSLNAYVKLHMTYPKGIDGVAIMNGFVDYAISNEREQIAADVNVIVKNRLNEIKGKFDSARFNYNVDKEAKIATLREVDSLKRAQLQDELKALRTQLKALRNDRIDQLKEAIGIAKSLGIQKPTTPSSFGESVNAGGGSVIRTEVTNQQVPLYFMGVDALKAELVALDQRRSDDFTDPRVSQIAKELQLLASNREVEVLNARKNEDVFLAGVQPLRAELARLSNLNTDMTGLKLVTVDQQALEPLAPVSPNRILVIALGLFAGLVLGICIALSRLIFGAGSTHAKIRATASSVPLLQPRGQGDAVSDTAHAGRSLSN